MYNNPLFAVSLPNSSIMQYSEIDSSDIEEDIIEEIVTSDDFNSAFTFAVPFSPIISINRTTYYKKNIRIFNYLCKGKKVKKLKI